MKYITFLHFYDDEKKRAENMRPPGAQKGG